MIAILQEHEAGAKTADLARKRGISEATIYNWKATFGGEAKRRFRILNIVEDVTKECLGVIPDTSISGQRVARELTAIVERRGKPGMIVSRHARLEQGHSDQLAFHRAGKADAERLC